MITRRQANTSITPVPALIVTQILCTAIPLRRHAEPTSVRAGDVMELRRLRVAGGAPE